MAEEKKVLPKGITICAPSPPSHSTIRVSGFWPHELVSGCSVPNLKDSLVLCLCTSPWQVTQLNEFLQWADSLPPSIAKPPTSSTVNSTLLFLSCSLFKVHSSLGFHPPALFLLSHWNFFPWRIFIPLPKTSFLGPSSDNCEASCLYLEIPQANTSSLFTKRLDSSHTL